MAIYRHNRPYEKGATTLSLVTFGGYDSKYNKKVGRATECECVQKLGYNRKMVHDVSKSLYCINYHTLLLLGQPTYFGSVHEIPFSILYLKNQKDSSDFFKCDELASRTSKDHHLSSFLLH